MSQKNETPTSLGQRIKRALSLSVQKDETPGEIIPLAMARTRQFDAPRWLRWYSPGSALGYVTEETATWLRKGWRVPACAIEPKPAGKFVVPLREEMAAEPASVREQELLDEILRLRRKASEYHRRAQQAEAAGDTFMRQWERHSGPRGGSFGRALASAAYYHQRERAEQLQRELDDAREDDEAFADDSLDLAHEVIIDGLAKLLDPKPQTCFEAASATINYTAACEVVDRAMGQLASVRTAAVRDVLRERARQQKVEGWTLEHDDKHATGSMAVAAACYALEGRHRDINARNLWRWTGWGSIWFKPKDQRSNLIRAGALILAEIERLDRADANGDQEQRP